MSTKNVTSTQQQTLFNPASMALYNSLLGPSGNALQSEIANPYNNMLFNQQVGMANQANAAQNASAMSSSLQRANALGMNKNSALMNWNVRQNALAGQTRNSEALNNLLLQAAQLRQGAIGQGLGYQPLAVGHQGTTTQQQSGLGTWLPQVASMGMTLGSPLLGKLFSSMGNLGGNFAGNSMAPTGFGGGWAAPGTAPDINGSMPNPFMNLPLPQPTPPTMSV